MNILNKIPIVLILTTWFMTLHAATGEEAGWISAFDGEPEHYILTRDSKTMPVALLAPLLVGDKIVVKEQHRIKLSIQGGDKQVVVTHSQSPFVISEEGKVPSPLGEFWKSVKGFMSYWYKPAPVPGPPIPAGLGKGDEKQPPIIPLLNRYTRLLASKRSLLLQWQHGKPPFKVQISHYDFSQQKIIVLWEATAVKTTWITTTPIVLEHNKNYRMIVTDAIDREIIRGFRALAQNRIEGYPQQNSLAWLLLQEDKDKWGFEILQRLTQQRYSFSDK